MPSLDWSQNLLFLVSFLVIFLLVGAVYGLIYSFVLALINFKMFRKEFVKQFRNNRKLILGVMLLFLILLILFIIKDFSLGIVLSAVLFVSPMLLIYAKAIEESAMVKLVNVRELTIGDWLVQSIKIKLGKKIKMIKPDWQGLSESELKLIQSKLKGKKILVKNGVPFVPAFLLGFILLLLGIFYSIV